MWFSRLHYKCLSFDGYILEYHKHIREGKHSIPRFRTSLISTKKIEHNVVMKTIYRSTKIVKISKGASSVVMLILTNYRVIKSVTL